jgi:4-hydroxy-tetrahydrodipicolinate synthase
MVGRSTFVISLTPFDGEERLDVDALRGHLRRMGEAGVGVYVAGGGSGEAYTLSRDESETILYVAAEELKGRVPVRAMGVEPRTALEMIEFGRMVERSGLEAMQLYSLDVGHGRVPSTSELEGYYGDVLDVVTMPVVLSTHQSVGYQLPLALVETLVERHQNIIGINVTNPDVTYLTRVVDRLGGRIEVHVGGPMQALTALALGATGYLSSEANVAPRLCRSVIDHWEAGDLPATAEAFARLLRLFGGLAALGGIPATKALLDVVGLPGGRPRRPRLPVGERERAALADLVEALDLRSLERW